MLMQLETGGSIYVSRRVRLTDDQIRRARAIQMYRMRLEGCSTREIATFFSFSPRHVNRELAAIPDATRRRTERNLGQVA